MYPLSNWLLPQKNQKLYDVRDNENNVTNQKPYSVCSSYDAGYNVQVINLDFRRLIFKYTTKWNHNVVCDNNNPDNNNIKKENVLFFWVNWRFKEIAAEIKHKFH